ncbi:MAG: heavy-metal-associated domain-containing protein, partial [Myxococcales bacterium]|nr:heavy-metal-associated domain-containing protein [Myxococcales bacterium]
HGDHGSPLEIVLAVALAGLMAWFAFDDLRAFVRARRGRRAAPEACVVELSVEGMSCGGCANKLRKALLAEEGVLETEVDHQAGRAVVRGFVTEPRLRDAVARAGYRAV